MERILIFTDLDGTLIDHDTYRFDQAADALETLKQRSIPVIICSSKTRAEIELYRLRMNLDGPFVVENGGAIFIPPSTFHAMSGGLMEQGDYFVKELGTSYRVLRDIWQEIKATEPLRMTGFSEMTVSEIASYTGLSIHEARLAAKREYSEPFFFDDDSIKLQALEDTVKKRGLQITRGGRFFHLTARNDKGRAVQIIRRLYLQDCPNSKLLTVALGDSANDVPMLKQVDVPIVIRNKTGGWERIDDIDFVIYSDQPGPLGWAESILQVLSRSRKGDDAF